MQLCEILKDIDDLTEPACMDYILMYLDELKEEDDAFMEILLHKVGNEMILWQQPWYQQTNSYTRPIKQSNERHTEKYKTDTICKAENEQLLQNWQEFREEYEVPDKLICLARWKNTQKSKIPTTPEERVRRFVISYLARGLERTLYQVFRHILTFFGGPVKGPYSSEEEKIMQVCFTHHPNRCVTLLAMVLGREPRGIYRRLHEMFHGKPERKKIHWTLPLVTKFVTLLMKYTGLPLEELRDKRFGKDVWLQLGQDFDQHYIYLQQFWYCCLHVQMFVKHSIKMHKLRRKIFKKLNMSSYQIWSDIRWKDIVQQFPEGYTHCFLYRTCISLVRHKPDYLKEPLPNVIKYALSRFKYCRNRRLKTLKFNENNELEVVIYNKSDNKQ